MTLVVVLVVLTVVLVVIVEVERVRIVRLVNVEVVLGWTSQHIITSDWEEGEVDGALTPLILLALLKQ